MAYCLDVVPSQLPKKYWELTHHDLKCLIQLKVGMKNAELTQHYENLIKAISVAFGGGKKESKGRVPKDEMEAVAMFNSIFGAPG